RSTTKRVDVCKRAIVLAGDALLTLHGSGSRFETDHHYVGSLLPKWNKRLVSCRTVPACSRAGVRKPDHHGVSVLMFPAEHFDPSAPKDNFASPLGKSGGHFTAVFTPFLGVLDRDMTYYATTHLPAPSKAAGKLPSYCLSFIIY